MTRFFLQMVLLLVIPMIFACATAPKTSLRLDPLIGKIIDTATRVCQDLCEPGVINDAEEGKWPAALWDALEESGLTLTWISDEIGGAGAEMADGFDVQVDARPQFGILALQGPASAATLAALQPPS